MIPLPEWHRLHMVACHGATKDGNDQTMAGRLFWKDLSRMSRQRTTLRYVSSCLVKDAILLSLFRDRIDLLTPMLKDVVTASSTLLSRFMKDYRYYERLAEVEHNVGTEYLLQFPSYMGTLSFETAFWRQGWDRPVLFSFLKEKRRGGVVEEEPVVETRDKIVFTHDKDMDVDIDIRSHRQRQRQRRRRNHDKRCKEIRKARKTKKNDKTLGRRFFPKEDTLLPPAPVYADVEDLFLYGYDHPFDDDDDDNEDDWDHYYKDIDSDDDYDNWYNNYYGGYYYDHDDDWW